MMLQYQANPWEPDVSARSRGARGRSSLARHLRSRRAAKLPCARHLPPSLGSGEVGTGACAAGRTDSLADPVRCTICVQAHCDDADGNPVSKVTSLPSLGSSEDAPGTKSHDNTDVPLPSPGNSPSEAINDSHHRTETSLPSLGSSEHSALVLGRDTSQDVSSRFAVGLPAKARKMQAWERWLLALVLLCTMLMDGVYESFAKSSQDYIRDTEMFDFASGQDWYLLQKAGIWSRQYNMRATAQPQSSIGRSAGAWEKVVSSST